MKEIKSYAKINLFLDVIKRYSSGYHEIRSIFSEISLYDIIKYRENNKKEIRIIDKENILPKDNLIKKACDELIKNKSDIICGFDLEVFKYIPIGGG